jgi:hypothetical protein
MIHEMSVFPQYIYILPAIILLSQYPEDMNFRSGRFLLFIQVSCAAEMNMFLPLVICVMRPEQDIVCIV